MTSEKSTVTAVGNLSATLRLSLHPDKVFIKTLTSAIDFLGWAHFPNHRILRTATRKRMFAKIEKVSGKKETIQLYLGLSSHGNTKKLQRTVVDLSKKYATK